MGDDMFIIAYEQAVIMHDQRHIHVIMNIMVNPTPNTPKKHQIRKKNTKYPKKHQIRNKKTPNTPKKTPNTPKKHQIRQKYTKYAKKHQLCKKNQLRQKTQIRKKTKYAKKHQILQNTSNFHLRCFVAKKFCSKFTHFVGVLFTGLKSMVVYQKGQI